LVSGDRCDLAYPTIANEEETENISRICNSSVEDEAFEVSINQKSGKTPLNPLNTIHTLRDVLIDGVKESVQQSLTQIQQKNDNDLSYDRTVKCCLITCSLSY